MKRIPSVRTALGVALLAAAVVVPLTLSQRLEAETSATSKLRGELASVIDSAASRTLIPISIVLQAQVDTAELRAISDSSELDERHERVSEPLKALAAETQADLLAYLRSQQANGEVGGNIRTLWLSNVVAVDATPAVVRTVAERDDVAWVNHNPKRDVFVRMPEPRPAPAGVPTTCGLDQIRAPEVWSTYGITGTGKVVAVIDTGVCYSHSDLANQMWVNPGEDLDNDGVLFDPDDMNGIDDDGNGFVDDFIGWDFDSGDNDPMDTHGHGTHVAGTVAGDGSGGTQTGVAPGADIMALRVGVSFADEMDVWNAMQYAADNNADVISMSLGWPHSVGPDRTTWRTNCENVVAMGTIMSIAAGNEGNCCNPVDNVRTPGDVPIVITNGATDCSDGVAGFSSRGPVTWESVSPWFDHPYPPGLIKPTVSAPGVDTISAALCSGYVAFNGTSMATPHVSGVIAMMLEASPSLSPDIVKLILTQSVVDIADPGQDVDSGFGRVDAFLAVTNATSQSGPEIFSVSPNMGANTLPTVVTITGENFIGDMNVAFGSEPATFVTRVDGSTLLVGAPSSDTLGTKDISIGNFFGNDILEDAFTYHPTLTVISTDIQAGEEVRLFAGGPPGGDWGALRASLPGGHIFKGFALCLSSDGLRIIDHSRRSPSMVLNGAGQSILRWEVPNGAQPGVHAYSTRLFFLLLAERITKNSTKIEKAIAE